MNEERRSGQRRRTLFKGYIVFNDRRSTVECMIRNLSDTGAQLKVATVVGIPDQFDLKINDQDTVPCVVRRRVEGELGVEFVLPGYDGPLLSVVLTEKAGGHHWSVMLAARGTSGESPLGYKAEGSLPGPGAAFQPFALLVHDEKRPVWTTMPDNHRKDVRDRIEALVLDAATRAREAGSL